jgi:prepilin-type processing-associated H-X9-DG protein
MNWMMCTNSSAPKRYPKLCRIKNPSEKILLLEEDERTIDDANGSIWVPTYMGHGTNLLAIRHDRQRIEQPDYPSAARPVPNPDRRGNVAFCDGHADYVPRRIAHSKVHCVGNPDDFPNERN